MASAFLDQRDKHLKKSEAFLHAAKLRLGDNLPYRAALSDAVEAIRHSLQAYLWMRASAAGDGPQSVQWQEIAVKASMPELVTTANDAGLTFSKTERETVLELARVRNHFTHDSPHSGRLITREVAERAVAIANGVDQRVQRALGTQQPAAAAATRAGSAPSTGGAAHVGPKPPVRPASGASGGPASATTTPAPAVPTTPATSATTPLPATGLPAQAGPAAGDEDVGEPDAPDDTTTMPVLMRRRGGRLWWLLSAAAMLVLGVAAGSAVTYPLASGRIPAWVPYASQLAAPTATTAATATPVLGGPFVAGNLLITPSACAAVPATLTLRNTGAGPVGWAAGSPDALAATFTDDASAGAHPTLTGQLAADASVTLTVAGLPAGGAHVVVIADGGTVALPLGVC
jgi:hypothetical protein